jgi:hypothetical protein
VISGVALAVLVGLLMFVNGATGMYRNPDLGWVFPSVATLVQLCVLIWGLRITAREGRRYGGQIVAGLMISLVAGLLIVPISLMWAAAYPDISEVMAGIQADQLADQGFSGEELEARLDAMAFARTPIFQAVLGFVATMITGLILSLIIAAFVRRKE